MSYYETPKSPFRDALKAITGQDPPDYVRGYNANDLSAVVELDELQSWCSDAIVDAGFEWMTGLGVIEAAELLVAGAVENGNIEKERK